MRQLHRKCIFVLICLMMLGNFAHGAVLCIGSDGHIALEFLHADNCDDLPAAPADSSHDLCAEANCSESADACDDCIDIPLAGACEGKAAAFFITKDTTQLKIQPKIIISAYTDNNNSHNTKHILGALGPPRDILTSISTTVLIV